MSARQHPAAGAQTRTGGLRSAPVLCGCAAALLVVRWLIPAEGVDRGDQLWIPAAWSMIAGVWCWLCPAPRRQRDWVDLGVALMVGGHLLGGGVVFVAGGNLRQAANLMAEWWGLGCAWLVLRELSACAEWSLPLRRALLAVAATAAALGIYQHYWGLSQSVREVAPLIERLRSASSAETRSLAAHELSKLGIPTTEPALTLFENRLRDSREPFGFFALANTLGGLLGAALVWGLAAAMAGRTDGRPQSERWYLGLYLPPPLLAIAWCLALTKSRTAWVGTAMGLVSAAFCRTSVRADRSSSATAPETRSKPRLWLRLAAAAVIAVLLSLAVGGLLRSGALDRDLLLEAPKSLAYRGQYWIGTLRLIGESPLLGVGLGQFRPEYLRVKLPEASEEIADPHNLLLDAWVNGGLPAVLGLIALTLAAVRSGWTGGRNQTFPSYANASAGGIVGMGGAAAFGLAFSLELLLDGAWDDRYLMLAALWGGTFWLLRPLAQPASIGAGSALAALSVHLLGAGGMEMPAVVQTGWVWLALATAPPVATLSTAGTARFRMGLALCLAGLLVLLVLWRPVLACRSDLRAGDLALQRGDARSALNAYARASEADRWDPAPALRSGELQAENWRQMTPADVQFRSSESEPFRAALTDFDAAKRRNPRSAEADRLTGELWLQLYDRSRDLLHARQAVTWLTRAVEAYPTNASLLAEWSRALAAAGDLPASRNVARRAIAQDDLNRRLGHFERLLPESSRQDLETRLGDDLAP